MRLGAGNFGCFCMVERLGAAMPPRAVPGSHRGARSRHRYLADNGRVVGREFHWESLKFARNLPPMRAHVHSCRADIQQGNGFRCLCRHKTEELFPSEVLEVSTYPNRVAMLYSSAE